MHRLSKQYGELDIKLKNSMWKSFRFKIMFFSLLSLILALVTDAIVIAGISFAWTSYKNMQRKGYSAKEVVEQTIEENIAEEIEGTEKSSSSKENKNEKQKKAEQEREEIRIDARKENLVNESIASSVGNRNFLMQYRRYQQFFWILIFLAIVLAIGFFLVYFQMFTRKMSAYLEEISDGIDQIATGEFGKTVRVQGEDEIANIAEKLNAMTMELQILINNEREYEKEKSDLITNVAHDLRTPLTSIIGYLDLVRQKNNLTIENKEKYISIAYDKSKRLEKLINDLFEFTKVGAERIKPKMTQLNFEKFMEQMIEEFYPSFQDAQLECIFEKHVEDGIIDADGDLLARGIENLFSNAVKYGRDGKVIKVYLKENKKTGKMHLALTNYGEIISEEDLEHIFDKFFRAEGSRSTETGGTGLGLAIAKKVILLHQGQIKVTSDYKGTVFSITLPIKQKEMQVNEALQHAREQLSEE